MKLTLEGIKDGKVREEASVSLPSYDVEAMVEVTRERSVWVHFGAGNIFHIFVDDITDMLISEGMSSKGVMCAETFGFNVIEKIYRPYDNPVLGVILKVDGPTDEKVIGSLAGALKAQAGEARDWERLKDISTDPGPQITSFIITGKGYALKGVDGAYFLFIQADIGSGLGNAISAMVVMCNLLYKRYKAGKAPLAAVSMNNCSYNGEKLQESVTTMVKEWNRGEYVENGFITYLSDRKQVSFPWSMIDKITPCPVDSVQVELENAGVEDMTPVITPRDTYIASFVNAEGPQYLVIENCFPNGRLAPEKAGVYITDRDAVNKAERIKVITCLNPLHIVPVVYGCTLGYTLIADEMRDPLLNEPMRLVGPGERIPVVTDPGILSPENFMNEAINARIPNPFVPDTSQRITTDAPQKVEIHYGKITKACMSKYGGAGELAAIPLAIAGWYRYLLAVDDGGKKSELSANPMVPELTKALGGIVVSRPEIYRGQLRSILSNANISGIDLYGAGIGETVEEVLREGATEPGAVRAVLKKYLNA